MKPKNLVYLHLDGLSFQYFWQYQSCMPRLWRLKNDSMWFDNCYVAGSSTTFAFCSLYNGSVTQFDPIASYSINVNPFTIAPGFADLLRSRGYQTAYLSLDKPRNPDKPFIYESWISGIDVGYLTTSPSKYQRCLEKHLDGLDKDRPFQLHVHALCDFMHLGIESDFFRENITSDYGESIAASMRLMEQVGAILLEVLEKRGLLDDCVLVAFGDHGFEMKKVFVKNYRGTHVYSPSSHVPLFVYNSSLGVGVNSRLVSLDDVPVTVSGLLFPDGPRFEQQGRDSGIDITANVRDYVVTQNKYALQDTAARNAESPKAYGITDGMYRLVVQEVDESIRTGGMELYNEMLDPTNEFELLRLFEFDGEGGITGLSGDATDNYAPASHPFMLNPLGLKALASRYERLRGSVRDYVRRKEREALNRGGPENVLSDKAFVTPAAIWQRHGHKTGRPFEEGIRKFAAMNRPVLLFGLASGRGRQVAAVLEHYGVKVLGIMDNSVYYQCEAEGELGVYAPEKAAAKFPDAIVLHTLLGRKNHGDVVKQCKGLGLECYSYLRDILGCEPILD